jgi:hypothetical protein
MILISRSVNLFCFVLANVSSYSLSDSRKPLVTSVWSRHSFSWKRMLLIAGLNGLLLGRHFVDGADEVGEAQQKSSREYEEDEETEFHRIP